MATDKQVSSRRGNVWGLIKECVELINSVRRSGLGLQRWAKLTYDFTVDGGAIGTLTLSDAPIIPIGAVIVGGFIDVTTIVVGAGASIGLGLGSGAQVASILAPAAVAGAPWSTTGLKVIIPVWSVATSVKAAADAALTMTVSGGVLTAGKFDVNIQYMQGN